MKGISALTLLGSMLGFGSQWSLRLKPQLESEIITAAEVQEIQEIGEFPDQFIVRKEEKLQDILPRIIPETAVSELRLYPEFSTLQAGDQVRVEYVSEAMEKTPLRVLVRRSKYEEFRLELTPEPSVVLDIFPLDPKSLVFQFSKNDLLKPNQEVLDVFDAEPGLLGVIDNQVDLIKGLTDEDQIEILAVGRYRGEKLERLEEVVSIRINQKDSSSLLFKYSKDEKDYWFSEDLTPCSFPFLNTPTDHVMVSSWFGEKRGSKTHKAIDFAANIGKPIYASADGVVSKSGWGTGYGRMVIIDHEQLGQYESLYAHMSRAYVEYGEQVKQGQIIGLVGNTGRSTGPHLHYEIRENGHKINPRSKSLAKKFVPTDIDRVALQSFRDQVDQVFVQATTSVVDVSDLLARKDI